MPFLVRVPNFPDDQKGGARYIDILDGSHTSTQRELRRGGYAGYEPGTAATLCAVIDAVSRGGLIAADPTIPPSERMTFYDVGANGGLYSFLVKAVFRDRVDVVAFEPSPTTAHWLEAINSANQLGIRTAAMALSDTIGETTLFLSAKSDSSNSLNEGFKAAHTGSVKVPVTTLDRYIAQSGLVPSVLKIDTETHEEFVLRGGSDLLRAQHPVMIIEALLKRGINYGKAVGQFLKEIGGYHFYHIGPDYTLEPRSGMAVRKKDDPAYRDWLVSPVELDEHFIRSIRRWGEVLRECTPATHAVSGLPRASGVARRVAGIAKRAVRRLKPK